MLIIYAPNVNTGGGKVLLFSIIEAVIYGRHSVKLYADSRLDGQLTDYLERLCVSWIRPTFKSRLNAERALATSIVAEDYVLCLGNIPPLFSLKGKVFVFIQNRLILDSVAASKFNLLPRIKLRVLFAVLKLLSRYYELIVQTPSMKRLLYEKLKKDSRVLSFFPDIAKANMENDQPFKSHEYDFLYVASGEPHKNHQMLFDAWRILAEQNIYPTLCVCLNEKYSKKLLARAEKINARFGTKISNKPPGNQSKVIQLYRNSTAFIYPSLCESFGLPLLEAQSFGMPIIASELDYVRDVVVPVETFDPNSSVSIARSVRRFLSETRTEPEIRTIDSDAFMNQLFGILDVDIKD